MNWYHHSRFNDMWMRSLSLVHPTRERSTCGETRDIYRWKRIYLWIYRVSHSHNSFRARTEIIDFLTLDPKWKFYTENIHSKKTHQQEPESQWAKVQSEIVRPRWIRASGADQLWTREKWNFSVIEIPSVSISTGCDGSGQWTDDDDDEWARRGLVSCEKTHKIPSN